MKGKLDKNGWLEIERNYKTKEQLCPFNADARCGDWCPLFNEPKVTENYVAGGYRKGDTMLFICQDRTLVFNQFADERE